MLPQFFLVNRMSSFCHAVCPQPLVENTIWREWRKCNLVLEKLIQSGLRMTTRKVIKWNSADAGKLQPFVVEPIFDLNDKHLVWLIIFIKAGYYALDECDEDRVVGWRWIDRDAHFVM